eukprot:TRINITY_DN101548_c0_g1_i2.p3 TRINITY_DN101548_c0_g1~~TRINITY_DN101548_c0_g1_i2.p3  ORF type:complete len:182 (+),score=8.03 TRINITY_DN101548_c0_g1_i2:776-1321(+)
MVQRLGSIFPFTVLESCSGCSAFAGSLWRGLVHGGSDVLVFFDFMGLPQIGQTSDGELVPRTEEETTIFQEALPLMGALYSMYPVLVLQEVTQDVHPYFSSGWCSSEFYTALLAKQLERFSPEAILSFKEHLDASGARMSYTTLANLCSGTIDETFVQESFNEVFAADLATKRFSMRVTVP